MIFVRRTGTLGWFENDSLRELEQSRISEWFKTPQAGRKRREYSFKYNPGSDNRVIEELRQVFANKCAYCEVKLDEKSRATLTFFRPLENALQLEGPPSPDHYWWLSWEWSNLYLACSMCIRKKGRRFPTAQNKRARPGTLGIALQEEEPLLLDPCLDEPAHHLSFSESGRVDPRDGSKRGETTIKILELNRDTLLSGRRKHAHKIKTLLKSCLQATDRNKGNVSPNIASRIKELGSLCGDDQEFAGMTRQLLLRWLREVELKTTVDFPLPYLKDVHWRDLISQIHDDQAQSATVPSRDIVSRERLVNSTYRTTMNGWPKSLVRAVERGRVIPFAGSGVAMALRDLDGNPIVPDWRGLLDAAAQWLDEDQRPEEAAQLRQRLTADSTFAGAFRTAYQGLGTQFLSFLQEKLDPRRETVNDASLELARVLWKLSSNFIVTIGHDQALKWACPDPSGPELIGATEVSDILRRLSGGLSRPVLWQAFGTLEDGDPIITFDGHRNLLPDPTSDAKLSATADSLQELFAGPYPILFIATSAPYFFSTYLFRKAEGTHYWLVRQDDFEQCRRSLRERDLRMIQPVPFPDFQSLPHLLNELAERRGSTQAVPQPTGKSASGPLPNSPTSLRSNRHPDDRLGEASLTQPFDVAIVCALHAPELKMVLNTGGQRWERLPQKGDPHTYHHTVYTTREGNPLRVIAAAPNQMGLAASAVLATKMILRFRPHLVAMVGIAAGVKSESQGFGDILAAEHTFDYGAGKLVTGGDKVIFKPDPKPLDIDAKLNARLNDWQANRTGLNDIYDRWIAPKPETILRLHVGPLGSGAAVIDNQGPVKDVMEHWRKLIGVEMEAYAVHRACKDAVKPTPIYLCLKSICDFAENKEDDWQPYAAFTAAQLCHDFLVAEWETLLA